jgi:nucleotide-binding universal stress UspA family protein
MTGRIRATKVFSSEREIVVGVDGSGYSKSALEWALREARLRDAVLRAICVAPVGSEEAFDWTVDNAMAESTKIVDSAVEMAESLEPTVVVRGEVLIGSVVEMLIAASEVADLLVVGARGRGALSALLLGSVSRSCAHDARCPVVIVHTLVQRAVQGSSSRIVVEVNDAFGSDALGWAVEEAVLRSAQVEAVFDCATSHDNEEIPLPIRDCNDLADEFTQFTSSYVERRGDGVFFKQRARCVSTVRALLAACEGADLLVVSEIGPEGVHERAVASLVRQCVHLSPCPVVVVGRSASSGDFSRTDLAEANLEETTAERSISDK